MAKGKIVTMMVPNSYSLPIANRWAKITNGKPKPSKIDFFLDSTLVANQLAGEYKIKNHALVELYATANNFIKQINLTVNFNIVPREENYQADALVNQALDSI